METIYQRPGIDINELIDILDVEAIELYKALKDLQEESKICCDGVFKINTIDGPLTSDRLDAILEEAVMKRGDISKAVRLSIVLNTLNTKTPYGGVTLKELAERCGVVEKSVRRYIETLEQEMKIKVIRNERPGQPTLFLLDRVFLPSISPEKAFIIFLSLLQQKGSALSGHVNTIKDTLVAQLFKNKYTAESLEVEELQSRIHIIEETLSDPVGVGEIFGKLFIALKDNHRVKIWYFTAYRGEETERVVEPYGLICKRQNWYLVGYCQKAGEVRTFRVDRIRRVHLYVYDRFEYPADFSIQDYMGQAWGVIRDGDPYMVRIKFNPSIAHLPRTVVYHPTQKIEEELDDGSIIVSYELCGLDELKTWVIQWGEGAEVLEPEILREKVRETAARIARLYGESTI